MTPTPREGHEYQSVGAGERRVVRRRRGTGWLDHEHRIIRAKRNAFAWQVLCSCGWEGRLDRLAAEYAVIAEKMS